DRRLLLTAAVLHDIGLFVSHKKHHKHAAYLIQHSEVGDFSAAEMAMIGNIARYHRKGAPSDGHEDFQRLSDGQKTRVRTLSALLRLADALDREHTQQVTAVRAEVRGDQLELTVEASGDLLLERWALERKADLFQELFGLKVSLTIVAMA
ncbi:MAG TPA: HD domain-containing protein, partial [Longimicrobiales bacterium]